MPAPGLLSPDNFPIRQPTEKKMSHGKVANPPRYDEAGGMYGSHVWFMEARPNAFAQSPQSNIARVEKATSEKSGHKSSREND